jgi:DHHC palmitoyltransferase
MDAGGGRRSRSEPRPALCPRPRAHILLARLERLADKASIAFALTFVAFVFSLICGVAVVYALVLRPLLRSLLPPVPHALVHEAFSIWLLSNVAFNYAMVLVMSPGRPQPTDAESPAEACHLPRACPGANPQPAGLQPDIGHFSREGDPEDHVTPGPYLTSSQRWRWCKICRAPKPPRAHHDRVTGACVLQMCHYCPAVSKCVGLWNYQFFARFIMYTWVGTLYCAVSCAWMQAHLPAAVLQSWRGDFVFFGAVGAAAIGVAVGVLGAFHIYLICTGQTTIECFENWTARRAGLITKPPFDAGIRANVELSFGKPYLACLPWWSVLFLPDVRKVAIPPWMLHTPSFVSLE